MSAELEIEYVQALGEWVPGLYGARWAIYLAGSVAGTQDWRYKMPDALRAAAANEWPDGTKRRFALLSPRRPSDADYANYKRETQQIDWESDHLSRADRLAFWFHAGDPCEAYFQLCDMLRSSKRMAVGFKSGYPRDRYIRSVVSGIRPDVKIVHSLPDLAVAVLRAKKGKAWRSPTR